MKPLLSSGCSAYLHFIRFIYVGETVTTGLEARVVGCVEMGVGVESGGGSRGGWGVGVLLTSFGIRVSENKQRQRKTIS